MDRKRKSMAESLQERERAATNAVRGEKSAALDKAETLQRLREEGLRRQQQLERELHEQREATQRAVHAVHVRRAQEDRVSKFESAYSDLDRTVKVRWDRKRYEHDARSLREKLVTFGDIVHVQVSKGKPTAVVQFASIVGARAAVQQAKSDDLDVQWASGQLPEGIDAAIEAIKKEHVEEGFIRRASVPPLETPRQSELSPAFSATSRQTGAEQATRPGNAANPPTSLDDYEAATMRRMQEMIEQRQREKRRKEALAKVQKDADSGDDANAS